MTRLVRNIVVTLALVSSAVATEYRTFTNQVGKTIVARVIEVDADSGKVQLELKNRKKAWVELSTLSSEDQAFMRQWRQKAPPSEEDNKTLSEKDVQAIAHQYIKAVEDNDFELWTQLFENLYGGEFRLNEKYFRFRAERCNSIKVKKVVGLEVKLWSDGYIKAVNETGWLQILPDGRIKYDPEFFRHPLIEASIMVKNLSLDRNRDGSPFSLGELKKLGIPCFGYEADAPRQDREESIDLIIDWLFETGGDWDTTEPHRSLPKDEFEDYCKWIKTVHKEAIAIDAGRQWLSLSDQAKYGESWEMTATFFKKAVKKEQWEQMATAVRTPLGKLEKRDVKSQKYQTSVPGAPDGEYVIIQFNTIFENKKETIETVTMMMDKDRGWRVSGYFVK